MKNPILQIDEFVSPLRCQAPNVLEFIDQKILQIIPVIEQYYGVKIKDKTNSKIFNEYRPICDNSIYRHGSWTKVNNYDFTCYVPLLTYNNKPPFDFETEVYGGSLIFTSFKKKYDPNMGTLLIYPSVPNFVHYHEPVKIGKLDYVKVFLTCEKQFVYNYKQWNNIL